MRDSVYRRRDQKRRRLREYRRRRELYFLREPQGDEFRQLLEYSLPFCDSAQLVLNEAYAGLDWAESNPLWSTLTPLQIDEGWSSHWPGTQTYRTAHDDWIDALSPDEREKYLRGDLTAPESVDSFRSWPNPRGGLLRRYRWNETAIETLVTQCRGLFDFEGADDLAVYRRNGPVWLTTVSHHRMGWLDVTSIEAKILRSSSLSDLFDWRVWDETWRWWKPVASRKPSTLFRCR